MTEEVSTYTQLAVILCCTSVIISVVVGVLIMGKGMLDNYNTRYTEIVTNASSNTIIALTSAGDVPCPVAYSTISSGISDVDVVYYESTKLYVYDDDNYQNLMHLMTKYKNKLVTVKVTTGELRGDMYTVYLKAVN